MHQLNVLIFGHSLYSTINELKPFLKFNPHFENKNIDFDIILFHDEILTDLNKMDAINKSNTIKIYVSRKKNLKVSCDEYLQIPTSLKELNSMVENVIAKKKFSANSSIKVKEYLMNKNEKKLFNKFNSIVLTEKEVKLIELLLNNSQPTSKDEILSSVWNYSADADTHTVETHIYRLRKKINDKFIDEEFILNSKDGYHL